MPRLLSSIPSPLALPSRPVPPPPVERAPSARCPRSPGSPRSPLQSRQSSRAQSRSHSRGHRPSKSPADRLPPLQSAVDDVDPDVPVTMKWEPLPNLPSPTCSATLVLAQEMGAYNAVLRGDCDVRLRANQAAIIERGRIRRAFERETGNKARAHARRWKKRESQQLRQCAAQLPRDTQVAEEALVPSAQPAVRHASSGGSEIEDADKVAPKLSIVPELDPNPPESVRMKRLNKLVAAQRKREQKLKTRKTIFVNQVAASDREAIIDAFAAFGDGRGKYDTKLDGIGALLACLSVLGCGGDGRDEHLAVVQTCEELLAKNRPIDLHALGLEVLPCARAALKESQQAKAMEHFSRLGEALHSEGGNLTLSACMVALDQSLGDMPGGRFALIDADSLIGSVLQRIEERSDFAEYDHSVVSGQTFMEAVQLVREAASRLLHDCHRASLRRLADEGAAEWDTRTQVDAGALEAAFRWVVRSCKRDGPLESGEASTLSEWRLSGGEVQDVLVQMGVAPLWRGNLSYLSSLERMLWKSCIDAVSTFQFPEHLKSRKKHKFDFQACQQIVIEARKMARRLAKDYLMEHLHGTSPADIFSVGKAIGALEVVPQTPSERSALCQELPAAGGDSGNLPCGELADVALRAQLRLQRDRRADELRIAKAMYLHSDLQKLRVAFVTEAFTPVVTTQVRLSTVPGLSSMGPKFQTQVQTPANTAKQYSRGQAALGDDGTISASGLRNVLLKVGQPLTQKEAADLASIVVGQAPPVELKGLDEQANGSLASCTAQVDFVGCLLAVRLLRDSGKDLIPKRPRGAPDEEGSTLEKMQRQRPLNDLALRVVLVSLSMAGRLTLAMTRGEQEALASDALLAWAAEKTEKEGTEGKKERMMVALDLGKMRQSASTAKQDVLKHSLLELVRRSRQWARDHYF